MFQILLVEDSIDIQLIVTKLLSSIAKVTAVPSVTQALKLVATKKFDLFLLDVMLEDGDGFVLASHLKQDPKNENIPVVFLTARKDIADKTTGFQLGAEDYIVKPFDHVELQLRIEARLKKYEKQKKPLFFTRGNLKLEIYFQRAFLIAEQEDLGLTPLQFKLLFCLLSREPEIISRDELIKIVWGDGTHIGRSIDTHINSLRKKLRNHASYIQTIYGCGYRFLLNLPIQENHLAIVQNRTLVIEKL